MTYTYNSKIRLGEVVLKVHDLEKQTFFTHILLVLIF